MKTTIITGTNRGVGLSLTKQLMEAGHRVIALCRAPSAQLKALNVEIIEGIDVRDPSPTLSKLHALNVKRIDLLINNAGILHRGGFDDLDFNNIQEQFEVNTLGPLRVIKALSDLLGEGSKIINITSRMGSIDDNTSGGLYGYRMSKAALNMATMSLAHDLRGRGVAVAVVHPGFVRTDMTGFRGLLEPDESAAGIITRAEQLTLEESGGFWHTQGERLPW